MTGGILRPAIAAAILWSSSAVAADLKPETVRQWDEYVKAVDARNQERLASGASFLSSDDIPQRIAKLQAGEIMVAPAGPHVPVKVNSGLIHDWMGAAFIANTTLNDVLPVVRDYDRYKDYYRPNVIESKGIAAANSHDQFSMLLINKSVVAKTALDSDYESSYVRVDERRYYSVSDATRIQEIAEYDTPSQHMLPEDQGTGLIWRLHSVTRFEQRDGGVYIEVEAVALSRDIPVALRLFVDPIVRRVARASLVTSLHQTEAAVQGHSASMVTLNKPTGVVRAFH
jgi:hypothetical protein